MSNPIKPERKKLFQDIMFVLHQLGELRCGYCKRDFSYADEYSTPTLDHILPLSANGSNHISNLTPCCKKCNNEKKSKLWVVKYQSYGFGVCGVLKSNYPMAWRHPSDILKSRKQRLYKRRVNKFFSRIKTKISNIFINFGDENEDMVVSNAFRANIK